MTTAQKIIKYFALLFAAFLIINILYGVLSVVTDIGNTIDGKDTETDIKDISLQDKKASVLNIDIAYANLYIKSGEYLRAESNNENIVCTQDNNKITIKEKNNNFLNKATKSDLTVYVPKDLCFDLASISTGAGSVEVESLNAKKLVFQLGAGTANLKGLIVTDTTKIEGGAGKLDIISGSINNLTLDLGVGNTNLESVITGNSKISTGIGKTTISLDGKKENYKIESSKGLGKITIDNKSVADGEIIGEGVDYLNVDGGIGDININLPSEII